MTPDEIQNEIDRTATVEVVQPDGSLELQTHPPIPIELIKPRADNPRLNDDAAKTLAKTIAEVGWGAPILIQKETGLVIGGHTRLKAAHIIGLSRLPVRILDVDDRRAKAMALADNRVGELAGWNWEGLATDLSEFGLEEVEAFGFDSKFLESLADKVSGFGPLDTDEDEVPDPPANPITKTGDVWTLGDHTLICGSCIDVFKNYAGDPFDMVLTDPPYGLNYVGGATDPRQQPKVEKVVTNDAPDQIDAVGLAGLCAVFAELKPGGVWYVTCPPGDNLPPFIAWAAEHGLRQTLAWVKDAFVFGRSDYHYRHEMILYGWKPGAAHRAPPSRDQDSVWEFDKVRAKATSDSDYHPTRKPVALFAKAINNGSRPGELIVDPFLGGGTTVVAAEQIGRRVIATEIDPGYCDVTVERWTTLTGKAATRKAG